MKEAKIIGAGLSGLTASIILAQRGYKVDVYEKNKDVGMRFNGDLQGLENWSEKIFPGLYSNSVIKIQKREVERVLSQAFT